ncbi:hypothetical protein DFQ27_006238, partial [Actinomortierella ambigua]
FSAVALIASVAAVASAAVNYPFAPSSPCMSACSIEEGKKIYPDYTQDPASPHFMKSIEVELFKGHPDYSKFQMNAGMCWMKCPQAEQEAYIKDFPARRAWFESQPPTTQDTGAASTLTISSFAAVAVGAVAVALF